MLLNQRFTFAGGRSVARWLHTCSPWRERSVRATLLGVVICTTAAANAAAVHRDDEPCAELLNGSALLFDEVTSAWQCDIDPPDNAVAVAITPVAEGSGDARLMLIVSVSSGAGWLARGFQKD